MRSSIVALALAALFALATPAAAQLCGVVTGVAVGGGYVSHRVANGTTGASFGGDAALAVGPVAARLEYRRMALEGDAADPDVVRATVKLQVVELLDVLVCSDFHGGLARFEVDADNGAVLAGGAGVTVTPTIPGPLHPYVSVRGLYGQATGTVLGTDLDASGYALGFEAGTAVLAGPLSVRINAAFDGFDDGLGATPYPATSIGIALGIRF